MNDETRRDVEAGSSKRTNGGARRLLFAAWVYGLAAAIGLGLAVFGAVENDLIVAGLGVLAVVIVLAAAPRTLTQILVQDFRPPPGNDGIQRDLEHRFEQLTRAIEELGEQSALSDDARRVLNRRRERDLLCRAIEEDIAAEDWDAGLVLVKELAERFGYRADAEEFRERIEMARFETQERRVAAAIRQLDALLEQRRWDEARAEAARIQRLYPDSARVEGLTEYVRRSREKYKIDLERRFLHAAQEEDIDEAMLLLKEMDAYLTEHEAQPFQEVARGVIGKARENLGVQFKLAVQDRRWDYAAEVGAKIIDEFPNTRMAEEIRGLIDDIRRRASALPSGSNSAV